MVTASARRGSAPEEASAAKVDKPHPKTCQLGFIAFAQNATAACGRFEEFGIFPWKSLWTGPLKNCNRHGSHRSFRTTVAQYFA